MPVSIGDRSVSINQEFRASDVRCNVITAPSLGARVTSNVTITFELEADVDADLIGSVLIEYSTAGQGGPWSTATLISGATTGLVVSPTPSSFSVVWDAATDIGTNVEQLNVLVGVIANDGTNNDGDADSRTISNFFTVDNLPLAPTITSPVTGLFRKDKDYPSLAVEFTISVDPGTDRLWPIIEIDTSALFTSGDFVQVDSNSGTNYLFFDVKSSDAPLKPISGYYVSGVAIGLAGTTTVAYSSLIDHYTGATLPTTITDARVIIVNTSDRRCYLESVSNTQVQMKSSFAGSESSPTVDLFILDDVQTNFYVVSGLAVTNTALTALTFSTMTEDFLQSIPNPFGSAPRVIIIDENDRLVYCGVITTTTIELAKSLVGADANGSVTLFIFKNNSEEYQDDSVAVTSTSLTSTDYNTLTDGVSLPSIIPGAIVMPNLKSDRHVYTNSPVLEEFSIAKSFAGITTDGSVDINIFTKDASADIWVVMPSDGIPDSYEGDDCRYRVQTGDFNNNIWFIRAAFGNV